MPRKRLSSRRNNLNHDDGNNNICSVQRDAKPGDIAWTKINGSSWWPVQVVNEENVTNKPKKKAEGEVLVRLYGTYEHFYLDATKSCSEFADILKIENSIRREAFQKALEKDLSQMKSGSKSKRKASGQTGVVSDAPKNKRQKPSKALKDEKGMQLAVEANQETLTLAPPGCCSDKSVKRSTEKRKDEALIQKKRKRDEVTNAISDAEPGGQDNARKTKISKKSSVLAHHDTRGRKQKSKLMGKVKAGSKKNAKLKSPISPGNHYGKSVAKSEARNRGKASREEKVKRGELKKPKLDEASTSKIEWGSNLIKAKAGEGAKRTSKAKTARQGRSRKSKISEESSDQASDHTGNTKTGSKENSKPKSPISPGKHPDSSVQKFVHKKTKSDEAKGPMEAKVSENNTKEGSETIHAKVGKVTNRMSKVKNARQDESKKTKSLSGKSSNQACNGTGEEKTGSKENMLPKSPTTVKLAASEGSFDSSVRKLRVMRNLGLMPPLGSPFGRKES